MEPNDTEENSYINLESVPCGTGCSNETMTLQFEPLTQTAFDEKFGRIPPENINLKARIQKIGKKCQCSKAGIIKNLRQYVPVVDLFMTYKFKDYILGDIMAGLSLGIVTVPQGMGYALLSDLPPIIGLYSSFFPVLVYFIFGRDRHLSIGTMALTSLILANTISRAILHPEHTQAVLKTYMDNHNLTASRNGTDAQNGTEFSVIDDDLITEKIKVAVSVSFVAGIILMLMSLFKLGILATYISDPFMGGYLASCNLQVLTHQLKHILGIHVPSHAGPFSFFHLIKGIIMEIKHTNIATLVISIIALVILFVVKKFVNERYAKKLRVPIPIDIIVMIVAIILSYFCAFEQEFGVQIIKEIPQGLPTPSVPSVKYMGPYLLDSFVLALINFIMVFMMVKMFSQKNNYSYDANQEMFASGISGTIGAFFLSTGASTSPPRTILGEATGGKTQIAQLISALMVLLTLLFLAPLLKALPVCVLACLIVISSIPLIMFWKGCVEYWYTSKFDLAVWVVSVLAVALAGVDYGLLIGIGFSIATVVFRTQRPYSSTIKLSSAGNFVLDTKLYEDHYLAENDGICIMKFEAPLYYATIDIFKSRIYKVVGKPADILAKQVKNNAFKERSSNKSGDDNSEENGDRISLTCSNTDLHTARYDTSLTKAIIVDCSVVPFVDTSGAKTLGFLYTEYQKAGIIFAISHLSETVKETLDHVKSCTNLVSSQVYPSTLHAVLSIKQYQQKDNSATTEI